MKVTFPDWPSALKSAQELTVGGCEELYLLHEGSKPYQALSNVRDGRMLERTHYSGGTGRYILSSERTGEFVAMVLKSPGKPPRFPNLRSKA